MRTEYPEAVRCPHVSQTVSNEESIPFCSLNRASAWIPNGLAWKTNARRWS